MARELRDVALDYLHQHQVMTLATVGADGPWAAAVFYVNSNFTFYFLSAAHTRHAQNFLDHPHVAATIQEDYKDWPAIKGIQLEGLVSRLQGQQKRQALSMYEQKYPFMSNAPAQIRSALAHVYWYQLQPQRLYLIDNSKGLGHRDEILLV